MNRGYVLDGFPKTYKQAMAVFMFLPEVENEENAE